MFLRSGRAECRASPSGFKKLMPDSLSFSHISHGQERNAKQHKCMFHVCIYIYIYTYIYIYIHTHTRIGGEREREGEGERDVAMSGEG